MSLPAAEDSAVAVPDLQFGDAEFAEGDDDLDLWSMLLGEPHELLLGEVPSFDPPGESSALRSTIVMESPLRCLDATHPPLCTRRVI